MTHECTTSCRSRWPFSEAWVALAILSLCRERFQLEARRKQVVGFFTFVCRSLQQPSRTHGAERQGFARTMGAKPRGGSNRHKVTFPSVNHTERNRPTRRVKLGLQEELSYEEGYFFFFQVSNLRVR